MAVIATLGPPIVLRENAPHNQLIMASTRKRYYKRATKSAILTICTVMCNLLAGNIRNMNWISCFLVPMRILLEARLAKVGVLATILGFS